MFDLFGLQKYTTLSNYQTLKELKIYFLGNNFNKKYYRIDLKKFTHNNLAQFCDVRPQLPH